MEFLGRHIDTGSQLNIVSKTIWKSVIKRPMDIAKSLANERR